MCNVKIEGGMHIRTIDSRPGVSVNADKLLFLERRHDERRLTIQGNIDASALQRPKEGIGQVADAIGDVGAR